MRTSAAASVYWHRVGGDELDEHRHKAGRCNPDRTHLSAVRRREHLAGSYLERRAQHHKSFVLTMIDIDVKPDKWSHWVVVGLPATVKSLPCGATSLPGSAKAIVSNFGDAAYSGPCPPKGTGVHHYEFTIWALPTAEISLADDGKATVLTELLSKRALDRASLVRLVSAPSS
jgi:Raf kinase inhibitor-like YbhB/YbcL family protein